MTAHDPRVTLTGAEREDLDDVWEEASWSSDLHPAVERIIAARLAPIRAVAEQWDTGCAREVLAALDATGADLSASHDHDGAEGQGEGENAGEAACDACPEDHCNATGKPWCTDEETR